MNYLPLSTLEECRNYLGNPQIEIHISRRLELIIPELQREFTKIAKANQAPDIVWKRDKNKLYAF